MVAAALLMSACANKEEPAKRVVAGAEATLAQVRDDATVYAPDELKSAEEKLATAKDNITWRNTRQSSTSAGPQCIRDAVKEAVVSSKPWPRPPPKWTDLSEQVPKIVEALRVASTSFEGAQAAS
jgi:hypothetical protein